MQGMTIGWTPCLSSVRSGRNRQPVSGVAGRNPGTLQVLDLIGLLC